MSLHFRCFYLFFFTFLSPSPSYSQVERSNYWEIKPIEPRIRWNPLHNPNLIADWQIRYTLKEDSVRIGGVELNSKTKLWTKATEKDNCRIVQSNLLYDESVFELCDLPREYGTQPTTNLNGEIASNIGTILLNSEIPIQAEFILSKSQKLLKVRLKKPPVNIVDISVENGRWTAILQNTRQTFSDFGLFDYTFPYKERLFKAQIDDSQNELILKGFLGLSYVMLLQPPNLEQQKFFSVRPHFKTKRDLITYSDKLKVDVYVPDENNQFKTEVWEIENLEKNKWNEIVRDYDQSKVSFYALRMPNFEASMRLSVVIPGNENILLPNGEISILGFHENFFSDQYDHFFTHRIGWKFRTFKSLQNFDPLYDVKLTQGEVRFLFNPAVWNIQETFGILGAAYQFQYMNTPVTAPGVGFFWGRAMPNIFDQLLRRIPWFKFPKYTDLDFTFIPSHHPKADASFVMNFQGKMFFPNNVFFEGGLSYYQFSTYNENQRITITLQSFVGTVGLGYMF